MMNERLLKEAFSPIIGTPAWNVKRGYGSFVTLEFGSPSLIVREPIEASEGASIKTKTALGRRRINVVGEYNLWIYCCEWKLSFGTRVLSTNGASKASINEACSEIDGRIFKQVDRLDDSGGIVCRFEDDLSLEISPDTDLRDDQWLFYHKDRVYKASFEDVLTCACRSSNLLHDE